MKYIKKLPQNEPQSLREYRETTPNPTYSGYASQNDLKTALLKEQGHICAYCMQRISMDLNENFKPRVEVEHVKSQKNYPDESLDYKNMVGVCNGNLNGIEHCDKNKKSEDLKKLTPTNKNCEELLTYSTSGYIISKSNNKFVKHDIELTLNLNNQHLVEMRQNTIDLIIKSLQKDYPTKDWTKRMFDKKIEIYQVKNIDGEYYQFCNYIVWFLNHLKKSPKYK